MQISPFRVTCLISWFLLVVAALISIGVPKVEGEDYGLYEYYSKTFWMTTAIYLSTYNLDGKKIEVGINLPILMDYYIYFIAFIILIALIVFSCCIISFAQFKNESQINGMYGTFSRYHFIPLLCATAIFIIGETKASDDFDYDSDAPYIFSLIFSIIGISVLILVHKKSELASFKLVHYVIKQLTYGWLFAIFVYNLFFSIHTFGLKKIKDNKNILEDDEKDFSKNCSISFVIIMGLFNLGISFFLKNIIICVANCFIYLGMTIWFFKIPDVKVGDRNITKPNGDAEGAIDIIMMILSLALGGFMIYKYKSQIIV